MNMLYICRSHDRISNLPKLQKLVIVKCPKLKDSRDSIWRIRVLTMQDSITKSKTINYILFMVFC